MKSRFLLDTVIKKIMAIFKLLPPKNKPYFIQLTHKATKVIKRWSWTYAVDQSGYYEIICKWWWLGNLKNVNSPFLFPDLIFKIIYSLRRLNLKSNRLSTQGFHENLHCRDDGRNRDVDSKRDRSSLKFKLHLNILPVQQDLDVLQHVVPSS